MASDKRKEVDDAYGDAVYEAWRAGQNPDRVDYERVRDDVCDGYDRWEAAEREVRRLRRRDNAAD